MKANLRFLLIWLTMLVSVYKTTAQTARFIRIVGPTSVTITAFRADGTLTWSNALAGTNYTVQTVSSLRGGTNWVDYIQLPVTTAVNTNLIISFDPPTGMSLIPAGSFMIGDTLDGESDAIPTNVTVSGFYMDTNLVSYSEWQSVYNRAISDGYNFDDPGAGKAADHPVQSLNWYDVVKWCNARSQLAGLTPVYYMDAGLTQVYKSGDVDGLYVNWTASGYRLPTEAEWEKAARGGLSGQRFPWGNTISWSQENYYGNPGAYTYDSAPVFGFDPAFSGGDNGDFPYTSPVGSFAPNNYGMNDVAGDVDEWCWDWYAYPYSAGSPYLGGIDPRGPAAPGDLSSRVIRGGSYDYDAYGSRCAYRDYNQPTFEYNDLGFRCVRGL